MPRPPRRHATSNPTGAKTQGDGSGLAMPQEDDPAGDGHRWSGKTLTPQAEPWGDVEVGGPGHIPTVPTEPRQC